EASLPATGSQPLHGSLDPGSGVLNGDRVQTRLDDRLADERVRILGVGREREEVARGRGGNHEKEREVPHMASSSEGRRTALLRRGDTRTPNEGSTRIR